MYRNLDPSLDTSPIVKPGKLERAQKMFPGINVTDQGYKYLGSYIGSEAGQAQYVNITP